MQNAMGLEENTARLEPTYIQLAQSGRLSCPITSAAGAGPVWIAVGDVNNDGHPDLVVANRDSDAYSVLVGNGTGGFQAPVQHALLAHCLLRFCGAKSRRGTCVRRPDSTQERIFNLWLKF